MIEVVNFTPEFKVLSNLLLVLGEFLRLYCLFLFGSKTAEYPRK